MRNIRTLLTLLVLCISVALSPVALAQDYPIKPLRLVNPFPPGTSTSIMSRAFAQKFQEQTGQAMIVDHRPGAASNLGSDLVAKSAPDGYTLLLGTSSLAINPSLYRSMPFDPIRDLAPIALLARTPNMLAVSVSLPVHSVKELIDYAQRNPGQLNYSSSGNGATNHLGMELFKRMARIDIVHIPFKGGADAVTALLGGQTQVMLSPPSTVGPHERTGRLRIIATGSERRIEGTNLPTVAEAGLPGFESSVWLGLFAPAGTAAGVIERLNREANLALRDRQMVDMMTAGSLTPVGGSEDEMRRVLVRDSSRFAEVVRASGAKID